MTGHDLVIVVPLWRRTRNVARMYESAYAATPLARVLLVASADDWQVVDYLNDAELDHLVVAGDGGGHGDYAVKINAGYRHSAEPLILTGADDVVPQPGWYAAASALIDDAECGRTNTAAIGVVGTVDGCNPRTEQGTHSTHSLVARWYADQGGCMDRDHVIYYEGYDHDYVDDELVQTALARGAYVHAFGAHVTHLHPWAGAAPDDETYARGRARTRMSRALYRKRSRLWNPAGVQLHG